MVQASAPRPVDQERAARVMLALCDNDVDRANRAMHDANADDAVHLMIAALASWLATAMQQPAIPRDRIREVCESAILDAQAVMGEADD